MKKLLVLMILILGISCQQNNPQPAPVTTPAPATNTPTNPPLTSQEQALVGNWILDKVEVYMTYTLSSTTYHTDSVNCHLDLMSSFFNPGSISSYKNCVNGLTCAPVSGMWRMNNNLLEIGYSYSIHTLSSSILVLQYGSLSNGGILYHFHK